jgi:hypothetical protein
VRVIVSGIELTSYWTFRVASARRDRHRGSCRSTANAGWRERNASCELRMRDRENTGRNEALHGYMSARLTVTLDSELV